MNFFNPSSVIFDGKIIIIVIETFKIYIDIFAASSLNWYCKRNNTHSQPIANDDIGFVEKYDGYYIDRKHGDQCNEKVVYLTFDAGYENGNISKILDILHEENVKGAFFILNHILNANTALILRMINEGHIVANHSAHHKDMTKINSIDEFAIELRTLEDLYKEKTGKNMPKYFRPPEGRFNQQSMAYAQSLGYKTIFWSIAYADWDNNAQPSPKVAKAKILDNIHNGAIILLHPTSTTNTIILRDVIKDLKAMGYRFGTLDELCKD